MEIQILEAIAEKEETVEGRNLCLTHVDWFGYNGHICLAFELLGDSVFDFLKDNEYQVGPVLLLFLVFFPFVAFVVASLFAAIPIEFWP